MNTTKQLLLLFFSLLLLVNLSGCPSPSKQADKQGGGQQQQQQQREEFLPSQKQNQQNQNNQNKKGTETKIGGGKEKDGKDGATEQDETQQDKTQQGDKGDKEGSKEDTSQDSKEDTSQDSKEQTDKGDKDEQQSDDKEDKGNTDPVPNLDPQATAYAAFYRKYSGSLKVVVGITANHDRARLNKTRGWFKDFKIKLDNDSDKLGNDGVGVNFSLNFTTRITVNGGWHYCASGELDSKKHILTQDERRTWLNHDVVKEKFAKLTTRSAKAGEDCSP